MLTAHVQAWAQAVRSDGTLLVIYSGNHEYIGIRHRDSRTLYLSHLIRPHRFENYGKLQIALYIAAIQEAMRRRYYNYDYDESKRQPPKSYPFDDPFKPLVGDGTEPEPKSRKRKKGEVDEDEDEDADEDGDRTPRGGMSEEEDSEDEDPKGKGKGKAKGKGVAKGEKKGGGRGGRGGGRGGGAGGRGGGGGGSGSGAPPGNGGGQDGADDADDPSKAKIPRTSYKNPGSKRGGATGQGRGRGRGKKAAVLPPRRTRGFVAKLDVCLDFARSHHSRLTPPQDMLVDLRDRHVFYLRLRYGLYDSRYPALFKRSVPSIYVKGKGKLEKAQIFNKEESLKASDTFGIILTSELGQGLLGITHGGTLYIGHAGDPQPSSMPIAAKLAITPLSRKWLRHEYQVYVALHAAGVQGIPIVHGLFEDEADEAATLIMKNCGRTMDAKGTTNSKIKYVHPSFPSPLHLLIAPPFFPPVGVLSWQRCKLYTQLASSTGTSGLRICWSTMRIRPTSSTSIPPRRRSVVQIRNLRSLSLRLSWTAIGSTTHR